MPKSQHAGELVSKRERKKKKPNTHTKTLIKIRLTVNDLL